MTWRKQWGIILEDNFIKVIPEDARKGIIFWGENPHPTRRKCKN